MRRPRNNPKLRRVAQVGLDEIKARERPAFEKAAPDNSNAGWVSIRPSKRTIRWSGILRREGFRYSSMRRTWVYDQHDDGSSVSQEEAEWLADRLRDLVAGDLTILVGRGIFVEPRPPRPPRPRSTLRPGAAGGGEGGAGGVPQDPQLPGD